MKNLFEKVKAFLAKPVVMIVESVLMIASAAGLYIGGMSAEGIAKLGAKGVAIVIFVDGVITLITGLIVKKDEAKN